METFQAFPMEIVLNNYRNIYQQWVDKYYYGLKFWSFIPLVEKLQNLWLSAQHGHEGSLYLDSDLKKLLLV